MKVKELRKLLEKIDPDLDVIFYTEDEELQKDGHMFTLLDFVSIDINDAERTRINEVASLKFVKSEGSEKIVTVTITSNF